jgi:hypothetical protein
LLDFSWEPLGHLIVIPYRVRLALIQIEIIMALWLLIGVSPRVLQFVAIVYFASTAAINAILIRNGEASCGCFGKAISISPWLTLGFSLLAIAAFYCLRPAPSRDASGILGQCVVMAMAGLVALELFRNGGNGTGEVSIASSHIEVGEVPLGRLQYANVTVVNRSIRQIRVVGGTRNCALDASVDLPQVLPPQDSATVRIAIKNSGRSGRFVSTYVLYADDGVQTAITGRIAGYWR